MKHLTSMMRVPRSDSGIAANCLLLTNAPATEWVYIQIDARRPKPTVTQCLRWALPEALLESDGETIGQWLATQLRQHGLSTGTAILAVDRRDTLLWSAKLPAGNPHELVGLVQCHVESQWADRTEAPIIGFMEIQFEASAESRRVLAAAIPARVLQRATAAASSAGFRILEARLGVLNLHRLAPEDSGTVAHIMHDESQAEVLLTQDGTVLYGQTVRIIGKTSQQRAQTLAAGITQVLQLINQDSLEPLRLNAIKLTSLDADQQFIDNVQTATGIQVSHTELSQSLRLERDVLAKSRCESVRVLSALTCVLPREKSARDLDFLHPWRPTAGWRSDSGRLLRVAALLGLCLTGAAGWLWLEHNELDRKLELLERERTNLTAQLEHGEPLEIAAMAIEDWRGGQIEWTTELHQFTAALPENTRLHLTRLEGSVRPEVGASLSLQGVAREADEVIQLQRRLVNSDTGYDVHPHAITASTSSRYYPHQFRLDIEQRPENESLEP